MEGFCFARFRFTRLMVAMQLVMGVLVLCISMTSLHRFYTTSSFLPPGLHCGYERFDADAGGFERFDVRALADRVDDVLVQLAELQDKLEATALKIGRKTKRHRKRQPAESNMTMPEFRRFLEDEVIHPLYSAHIALRLIRIPRPAPEDDASSSSPVTIDPLVNFFTAEETRKYVTAKGNRDGRASVYGTNRTYGTVGHACVLVRRELDEYMSYDVGARCPDDWDLAQRLMLAGCDPLPRRRCLAPASKLARAPMPLDASLWALPDDGNVRWDRYHCRGYKCLSARNPRRGYNRCVGCFDMDRERARWMVTPSPANGTVRAAAVTEFRIDDVLAVKPGELRVGLDLSVTTGSFAARMRERGVTIVSAAMNVGAPFAETIALRGLFPLYATMSQRLPLFDNTMDLVHTAGFFEGWVDLQLLDFVLFDWDRVLRPGGLLWVDRFVCERKDLDDYMYMFLQFRYKKHRWVVSFKSKDEVYLSALLEKPPRS